MAKDTFSFIRELGSNGWIWQDQYESPKSCHFEEYATYKMAFLSTAYVCDAYAVVSENDKGLDACGELGVVEISVDDEEHEPPFNSNELKEMLYTIEMAEDNLLLIGIPFVSDYKFHGDNAEEKKKKNMELRTKLSEEINHDRHDLYTRKHKTRQHSNTQPQEYSQ